ncbi:hypothetical protein ABZ348_30475 [Streptomyces sp. NPDC005963]|uniref:hypothetical protein n=1 Tax=Streptomyces sp. NPDC005963 TaxID=3156721 RepID=UPI0033ECE12B
MDRELTLICSTCAQEIAQDDGYLWVNRREADTAQQAYQALEQRQTDPLNGSVSFDLADLCALPAPAAWRADHRDCDLEREDPFHYRIPAARLHLRADLLDWTAHLTEKVWLPHTDWRDLLRETRTGSARLAVSGPRPPAHLAAF